MIHRTEIQVRFNDTDALGHLNNSAYALYCEHARISFLHDVGGNVGSLILAHLALDFRRQVKFGDHVTVETWVKRLGSSSVTLGQQIQANGKVAADAHSVVVRFDYEVQKPKPLTEVVRRALEAYVK